MEKSTTQQTLVRATRAILRALVRVLLRNGISYGAFSELAKRSYVEAVEQDYRLPGKKLSSSRISTLTGLTRKEVTRLRGMETDEVLENLERYNRAARVISGWVRDTDFHDAHGQPAVLPMEGEGVSFSSLVQRYSGDIPVRAIFDELQRVGAIEVGEDERLELKSRAYIPQGDEAEGIKILGTDVADLISTIDHNIGRRGPAYFQRKVSYNNLTPDQMGRLRDSLARQAQACLEAMDRELVQCDRDHTPEIGDGERVRAGVGIYYFEQRGEEE
jgi:hypothetical protein